jgi:hypothetical protein
MFAIIEYSNNESYFIDQIDDVNKFYDYVKNYVNCKEKLNEVKDIDVEFVKNNYAIGKYLIQNVNEIIYLEKEIKKESGYVMEYNLNFIKNVIIYKLIKPKKNEN